MPETGDYILTSVGFSKHEKPLLILQQGEAFIDLLPVDQQLTLRFAMAQRFCVGWRDITNGERHVCPDRVVVDRKYEQCGACQKRTGFNPAFYNSASVSPQQESRNLEPHILYLAYFGSDTMKVGISHAARGNSRLLEQGARSALILDTFPSAHIARHYEAKIAALSGIYETVLISKKVTALASPYDQAEAEEKLLAAHQRVEAELHATFSEATILHFDHRFFPHGTPLLAGAYDAAPQDLLSGKVTGMLGSLLFCEQQDTQVFLALKKYIGYQLHISSEQTDIDLPAQQISLF
ncbi:hypothetical protein D3C85_482140 [compost metagenome]